jgi:cell volume regulation protein A
MEFSYHVILIAGVLLLLSVLVTLVTTRTGMPMLLGFLGLGMLMGEDGPGGIQFNDMQTAYLVGSLSLAVILFDGGLRTDAGTFRVGLRPALSLATVGVVVTALITGVAAAWLLNLPWLYGLLIGAIVGSTDAAAVFSILHAHGLALKQRVEATLEIESGSNDPMAIFLTVALVGLLGAGGQHLAWSVIKTFVLQFGLGGLCGAAGGYGLLWLINRVRIHTGLYPLLTLAGVMVVFGFTAGVEGSGFLAVYLCGIILGNRSHQAAHEIRRFHDGMAWLSQITMFVVLGLLVTPSQLAPVAPLALAVAAVLIFVARPAAVALSLAPYRFPWREQLFIGWVGLRGAVPIILAVIPLLAGVDHADVMFNVTFFVVLLSLVLQGWTVTHAARWLGLEVPPRPGPQQRMELSIQGRPEFELVGYRIDENSPAVGQVITELPLPGRANVAAVFRGDRVLRNEDPAPVLAVQDHVYVLAQTQDIAALDQIFVAIATPKRLEAWRFFGEFVLKADARLADVADVYGIPVPDDAADQTVGDYLGRTISLPVVGDRCRVGSIELVVREIDKDRITRVGLKLREEGDGY